MRKELLEKYFNNTCSEEELSIVLEWFEEYAETDEGKEVLFRVWDEMTVEEGDSKTNFDHILHKIHHQVNLAHSKELLTVTKNTTQKYRRRESFLKIAAAAILIIAFALGFWAKGLRDTIKKGASVYNEIIVPVGEKAQIVLADGSHIWINSGSKLKYPVKYNTKTREVFLQGEAYFDVANNEKIPFIVNTEKANIRVFGTAFNVKFYPGDANVETTVVRGLVRVEDKTGKNNYIFIKPREKCLVSISSKEAQNQPSSNTGKPEVNKVPDFKVFTHVNTELVTSWKDQLLVFSDERFDDLAVKLERWYNIKIVIEDESLKGIRFRGKFVNNETIYQVLDVIKITANIKYRVVNNAIYINKK